MQFPNYYKTLNSTLYLTNKMGKSDICPRYLHIYAYDCIRIVAYDRLACKKKCVRLGSWQVQCMEYGANTEILIPFGDPIKDTCNCRCLGHLIPYHLSCTYETSHHSKKNPPQIVAGSRTWDSGPYFLFHLARSKPHSNSL